MCVCVTEGRVAPQARKGRGEREHVRVCLRQCAAVRADIGLGGSSSISTHSAYAFRDILLAACPCILCPSNWILLCDILLDTGNIVLYVGYACAFSWLRPSYRRHINKLRTFAALICRGVQGGAGI